MILFDVTKTGAAGHRSGLTRVSARLQSELGSAAQLVGWDAGLRDLQTRNHIEPGPADWFLTSELFSEEERPGFSAFLASRPCPLAAIFHDAIPLKHPHITWPRSVARHPGYLKLLTRFDRVWAVSAASRDELLGFWRWQGIERPPRVDVLALGADFNGQPRVTRHAPPAAAEPPLLLCLGIIEPRKNQALLLDAAEALWRDGLAFELHFVGRINPHFGRPIAARIKALQKKHRGLHFHAAARDAVVAQLYARARATAFPSIAEGCGLPLLESLWMGVPCVCSDLPVLRENADAGGCVPAAPDDAAAWASALRRVLTDDAWHARLAAAAASRPLPTWAEAAQSLVRALAR
jgi:glycosyltransferase involved in cell wall biosynthesis